MDVCEGKSMYAKHILVVGPDCYLDYPIIKETISPKCNCQAHFCSVFIFYMAREEHETVSAKEENREADDGCYTSNCSPKITHISLQENKPCRKGLRRMEYSNVVDQE